MVPEAPLAPVSCASHILSLALSFAAIPTAYLASIPWIHGAFSLICNPLHVVFHSKGLLITGSSSLATFCLFLPSSILQDALVYRTSPENSTASHSSPTGGPLHTHRILSISA